MENPASGCGPLKSGKSVICRLCMKTHEYYLNIFVSYEEFTMSIGKAIEDLLVLKVAKDDNLPKMVCCPCVTKLMEFREFKEMCMNSAMVFGKHAPVEPVTCPVESVGMPVRLMDGGEVANVEKKSPNQNEACEPLAFDNLCPVKDEFRPMQLFGGSTSGSWSNCVDGESRVPVIPNYLALDPLARENQTDTKEEYPRDPLGEFDDCGEEDFAETEGNEDAALCSESKQLLMGDQVDRCNKIGGLAIDPEKESDSFGSDGQWISQKKAHINPSCDPVHEKNLHFNYSMVNSFVLSRFHEERVKNQKKNVESYPSNKKLSQLNDTARSVRNHELEQLCHQAENASFSTDYVCNYCSTRYSEKKSLGLHMKRHVDGNMSASILSKRDFPPRLSQNQLVKAFKCKECGKMFNRSENLRTHSRIHFGLKPFKCNECGKMFTSSGNLKKHSLIHTGVKAFKCNDCGKMFTHKSYLKVHLVVHTGVKPFKCNECGKMFSTRIELSRHSVVHTGVKAFKCNDCGKMFTLSSYLKKHSLVHTGVKAFKCNDCGKMFTQKIHLKIHSVVHTGVKTLKCNDCGKMFSTRGELSRHSSVHTGVKAFKCNDCGKMFTLSSNLKKHSLVHSGVKAFKCNDCGKMFTQKIHLKIHSVVHTGVKTLKCNDCGKMFSTRSELSKHSVVHTGVKAFKCNECGKMFKTTDYLNKHLAVHTGVKPFKCNDCGKMFYTSSGLNRHSVKHKM